MEILGFSKKRGVLNTFWQNYSYYQQIVLVNIYKIITATCFGSIDNSHLQGKKGKAIPVQAWIGK
jgi:hypothetical protein